MNIIIQNRAKNFNEFDHCDTSIHPITTENAENVRIEIT